MSDLSGHDIVKPKRLTTLVTIMVRGAITIRPFIQTIQVIVMSHTDEAEEILKIHLTSAFRQTIDEILTNIQHSDGGDITTKQLVIAYNKKSNHVEILKTILIDNEETVLEPPIWTSHHNYNPLNYDSDTDDRITILEIPTQIPYIEVIMEKIKSFEKL